MTSDNEIKKGDIVENLRSGQTFRVMSIVDGRLNVKGDGLSTSFGLSEVKKAPPRPVRTDA